MERRHDTAQFGRYVAQQEQGVFTEYGYLVKSGDEWQKVHEGQSVPEEYRVTPQPPQPERPDPSKVEMDAAAPGQRTAQTAEQPQEPRPVIPIVLTSEKPAEKLKEIPTVWNRVLRNSLTASVTRNI